MKKIVFESGKIAMDLMGQSEPSIKGDNSIITRADRSISNLVHQHLDELLKNKDHLLIDEEDSRHLDYLDQSRLKGIPYIWAIDPIDGTRIYANHMPHFGISLGLLKDLKPWLGAVYFPMMEELFFCDGKKSFFVRKAFTPREKIKEIKPIELPVNEQSVFFCHDSFFRRFDWDNSQCRAMILACAVVDLCWPAVGRGVGGCLQPALWDFCGSWPIAHSAGLQVRSYPSGKRIDCLEVDLFKQKGAPWELKDLVIVSSEKNFPVLKNLMKAVEKKS